MDVYMCRELQTSDEEAFRLDNHFKGMCIHCVNTVLWRQYIIVGYVDRGVAIARLLYVESSKRKKSGDRMPGGCDVS